MGRHVRKPRSPMAAEHIAAARATVKVHTARDVERSRATAAERIAGARATVKARIARDVELSRATAADRATETMAGHRRTTVRPNSAAGPTAVQRRTTVRHQAAVTAAEAETADTRSVVAAAIPSEAAGVVMAEVVAATAAGAEAITAESRVRQGFPQPLRPAEKTGAAFFSVKLIGPPAACSAGPRLSFALEIERHRGADEILQSLLVDMPTFLDVDGAPDIPIEAGVE